MLTRHDIGHRVTIRRRIAPSDGHQRYSELIGELVEVTDTDILVRTSLDTVRIAHAAVTAARRMPDRRPLSATGQLERVASAGWPASELSFLGDWHLRAAEGWTARANSALAIGQPGMRLPDAIDAVTEWYTARRLRPAIMVPEPIGARVTAELQRRGWRSDPPVLMMTAPLGPATNARDTLDTLGAPDTRDTFLTAVPADRVTLRCEPTASEAWFALAGNTARGLPSAGRQVLTAVPTSRFAGAYAEDDSALGIARGVIAEDNQWLGLSAIEVVPAARRRGLAIAMIGALMRWAADEGASRAYLQVLESNAAAIALYDRLGFTAHHRYRTWAR